jgi:hypothetical protein
MRTINYVVLAGALALAGGCKKADEAARDRERAAPLAIEADEAQRLAEEKAAAAKKTSEEQLGKQRSEALDKLHDQLEAADRKTDHLREKLGTAKGEMKENAAAAAEEVQKRRAKVEADLGKLAMASADGWERAHAEAERDLAALDRAVENFEKTLEKRG